MFTNALNKTLHVTYPTFILMAVLASAGISIVQAGGSDLNQLFPDDQGPQLDRTTAAFDPGSCSATSGDPLFNTAQSEAGQSGSDR